MVVVDVRQLVENLEGINAQETFAKATPPERRALAAKVTKHLLHLIATVSPGARRGATAPFAWARFMLVEAGDWQPRSLAGAFQDALPLRSTEADPLPVRAVARIARELETLDAAYAMPTLRRFLALDAVTLPEAERHSLDALGDWVEAMICDGTTGQV